MKPWVSQHGTSHVKTFIEFYPPLTLCFAAYGFATGNREIIDIVGEDCYEDLNDTIIDIVVHFNHWDLLLQVALPSSCIPQFIKLACKHQKIDVLRTLYHRYGNDLTDSFHYYFGTLETIQFFQFETTVARPDETILRAPACTSLEIVQYLVDNNFTNLTIHQSVENEAFDVIVYLNEHDVVDSWDQSVELAAINGHSQIVQYLLAHRTEGFDDSCLVKVIKRGHLKCLQLLIEYRKHKQTQWQPPVECIVAAVQNDNDEIRVYLHNLVIWPAIYMNTVAQEGNLELLKTLHDMKYFSCTKGAMDKAAAKGYLDIVQFLYENRSEGCTECAIDSAAGNGHLDVVQFLLEHKLAKPSMYAMTWAAVGGHLYVVKYLHEVQNAPYCSDIGDRAAKVVI
ncbi:hypothetical protein THRCLA_00117 [Thraustotheca clavata]|uniref:Uncharacterized protein n=1 Tax=Thraustotheca clavata TaxID=74557 RepID=A0A1W0AC75_9STRA|nr:hypothetical protein THRCLA_00117 [Thraustotheca clavata]